jgi:hypothetical protein
MSVARDIAAISSARRSSCPDPTSGSGHGRAPAFTASTPSAYPRRPENETDLARAALLLACTTSNRQTAGDPSGSACSANGSAPATGCSPRPAGRRPSAAGWVGAPGSPAHAPCWERRPGAGCRPQPHRRGGGGLLDVGSDSTRSLPSAEPSRGAGTTATRWAGSPAGSSPTGSKLSGLCAGRAAGQRQRSRHRAGHHLAVATQRPVRRSSLVNTILRPLANSYPMGWIDSAQRDD